mgnify:CR=1 FL=1
MPGGADGLDEARRLEQRLGRDAPAMEAGPADLVLIDKGDLQAELAGPEGGGIAAGACAEQPAPLLLWIHGGPLGSWNGWRWRWNPRLMVAKGYAVLLTDPAL